MYVIVSKELTLDVDGSVFLYTLVVISKAENHSCIIMEKNL